MKLSHFDRTLIHGLAQMSRPPLVPDPVDHKRLFDIITLAADRATPAGEMVRLIDAAGRMGETPQAHRGTVHEICLAMNAFDRMAMAAHWDAARGVS